MIRTLLILLPLLAVPAISQTIPKKGVKSPSAATAKAPKTDSTARHDSAAQAPGDSLQLKEDSLKLKRTAVAFLGLESISENRFHETLEERVYTMLSYNSRVSLEPKDFFFRLKSRGVVSRKLQSMNEAVDLMQVTGVRVFISGEIRDFRIELKRYLGFLPFGRVTGEIVCYLQVLDALEKNPRFAGNLRFVGERRTGWVGFGDFAGSMPLSPVEEKHFVFELINGMSEAFVETAEAAYTGIIGKSGRSSAGNGPAIRREDNLKERSRIPDTTAATASDSAKAAATVKPAEPVPTAPPTPAGAMKDSAKAAPDTAKSLP